jgi:hypothetical protein
MPVSRAPARARQPWPSARAASPVIHWLRPLARAAHHADVVGARAPRPGTGLHRDAAGAQPGEALAGHERIGVREGADHPRDAGGDQRVAAGTGAAVMRARLEGDVRGGAAHVLATGRGIAQGHDLCVRLAGGLGVSFPEYTRAVGGHQDASDAGIRLGVSDAAEGERQGPFGIRLSHVHRPILIHGGAPSPFGPSI